MISFGKWLLERRKAAGLTQGQLAKKAGISTSYVSTLERGQKHTVTDALPLPKPDIVDAIAKALLAPLDEARLAAGYAPQSENVTFDLSDKARIALLDSDLTPEDQAEIVKEMALAYEVVMARRKARLNKST